MNHDHDFINFQKKLGQAQLNHFDPTNGIHQEHLCRYEFAIDLIKPGSMVLDIASGIGYGSRYISDNVAYSHVNAGDISEEAIKYAKDNFENNNVFYQIIDGTAIPFQSEYFDCITSFETIEHIPNYNKFLNELHRVLKPGGTLILSTPNREFTNPLGSISSTPLSAHHCQEWRKSELELLIQPYFTINNWYTQHKVINPTFEKLFICCRRVVGYFVPHLRKIWNKWHDAQMEGRGNTLEGLNLLREKFKVLPWDDSAPGKIILFVANK